MKLIYSVDVHPFLSVYTQESSILEYSFTEWGPAAEHVKKSGVAESIIPGKTWNLCLFKSANAANRDENLQLVIPTDSKLQRWHYVPKRFEIHTFLECNVTYLMYSSIVKWLHCIIISKGSDCVYVDVIKLA